MVRNFGRSNRLAACQLQRHTTAKAARKNNAVTDPGDVVWEPCGGLASAAVAAVEMGRFPYVAEIDHDFAELAAQRLDDAAAGRDPEADGTTP
jgi:DNA modification methylase